MGVICSSETLVHTRITRHNISEDGNVHNYRCANLEAHYKCYTNVYINMVLDQLVLSAEPRSSSEWSRIELSLAEFNTILL
jgi:hypothetical protein